MGPRLIKSLLATLLLCTSLLSSSHAAEAVVDATDTARLHALFDARWERLMRTYPEWATLLGDDRYGDRLEDASREAIAANFDAARHDLAQARAIRRDALAPKDQVSLDVFMYDIDDFLLMEPYVGFRSMSLGALFGFQSGFAFVLQASPTAQRRQVE